jgi:hypothetical protein
MAALEEGSRGAASRLEAGGGADQLIAGHLAGIVELDQAREALLETVRQGQRPVRGTVASPNRGGCGGRVIQSGAAECRRHDGRGKGRKTSSGGLHGPPRRVKGGAADPKEKRRT